MRNDRIKLVATNGDTLELYFYKGKNTRSQEIIAFIFHEKKKDKKVFVCNNYWGAGCGRILNKIDGGDKRNRLSRGEFDAKLEFYLIEFDLFSIKLEDLSISITEK